MKSIFTTFLLFPIFSIAQSFYQLSEEEINLLNISQIDCNGSDVNARFIINGAGRSGTSIIIGIEYSEKTDTIFNENGKIKSTRFESVFGGTPITHEYYYSDTLVNHTKIAVLDSIQIYWNEIFGKTIKFKYRYELDEVRKVYNYLLGTWTICYSFPKDFVSYDPKIDSMLFVRDAQSCSFKNDKYSNGHCLTFIDNDSIIYQSHLNGKENKAGIPYFSTCSKWNYDQTGLKIGYLLGISALYGKVQIVDQNQFWLVFDEEW